MELGDRIRVLRTKNRLSQGDLARVVKSATSTISEIERDERKPRTELLLKMADYFDVSIDFLLGRIPEDTSRELAELKTEMDELRKDYEIYNLGVLKGVENVREVLSLRHEKTDDMLILMGTPETVDENTRNRLEAEYDLRIRTSRLEEKDINRVFRFLIVIERMKGQDGGAEKNE